MASRLLGQRLRRLRRMRGLSQRELAERAGLSENAIGSFERGERFPRAGTLDALAQALQTPGGALLEGLLSRDRAGEWGDPGFEQALFAIAAALRDRDPEVVREVVRVVQATVRAVDAGNEDRLGAGRPQSPKPSPSSRMDTMPSRPKTR